MRESQVKPRGYKTFDPDVRAARGDRKKNAERNRKKAHCTEKEGTNTKLTLEKTKTTKNQPKWRFF